MECPQCKHANPSGTKFCGECGTRLQALCTACKAVNPPGNKFCGECGQPLGSGAPAPTTAPAAASEPPPPPAPVAAEIPAAPPARFASPETYTPKHLAEKILTSRSAIEGERKIVTVLFSDVSGFTAISEKLDPEDVHAIMDRAFEVIHTPGHSPGGIALFEARTGILLSGDIIYDGPLIDDAYHSNRIDYALTLEKLRPLRVEVVHGGHFPSFGPVRYRQIIDEYLAGTRSRIERLLNRLREDLSDA